jgi:hypothetical protein
MDKTLKDLSVHEIHAELIEISLRRGQDFEITQVHKTLKDKIVYIIAASPEKKQKLLLHQVAVCQELFTPNLISQQTWTKKEIAKKNCLTLIVKNVNIAYSQSEVTEASEEPDEQKKRCVHLLPQRQQRKGSTRQYL